MYKKNVVIKGNFPNFRKDNTTIKHKKVNGCFGSKVIMWVWVCVVMIWPLLRWLVAIDCFFQFVRFIYYFNTASAYAWIVAGLVFMAHFIVLSALTYFVSIYKPKFL